MGKPRSKLLDFLVYLFVRVAVCILQMLTWDQARALARGLAWLAYHVDKRHRRVAMENIRQAFPGRYTEAELDAMVRKVFCHFATLATEMALIPRKLHVNNHKQHVRLINGETIVNALLSERPLLIVTGHFGNWELAGYYLGLCGFTTHAIARPLDNPYLDDFIRKFRERTGQRILAKKGDFDRILDVLESGGVMATLVDQDAGRRGVFVDFFGRPASTQKAAALMALENDVPIIVSVAIKVGEPLKYEIVTSDCIDPADYRDHPDPIRAITERYTKSLEELVRRAPEQYFWLHNRWKTRPATRKKKSAA